MPTLREKRFARLARIERRLPPFSVVAPTIFCGFASETLAGVGWILTHRPVW